MVDRALSPTPSTRHYDRMIRLLLRQDAASVFFVIIAGALLAWLVWTLFR